MDLWTVAFLLSGLFVSVYGQIEVNTKAGLIRGRTEVKDGMVHVFLGIPYAKPPILQRRFQKPEKPDKFQYPFVADLNKPFCAQVLPRNNIWDNMPLTITRSDEDCLYLNIYAPERKDKIPVVVFLGGENYLTGRGDIYDGQKLAIKGSVIVVTLNYRLGIFGFLSTGNTNAPGNMGLWDQLMALEWVRDNIAAFGGDPNDVTLMGWSSGASSAALHALSRRSKGLFKRVILQGGAVTGPTVVNTREDALRFAKAIGIQTQCYKADKSVSVEDMVNCLKGPMHLPTVLAIRAVRVARGDKVRGLLNSAWVPVIDGDFIPDDPTKLLTDHSYLTSIGFYDLDIMLGMNRNEGTHLLYLFRNVLNPSQYSTLITTEGVSSTYMINSVIPALVGGKFGQENVASEKYVRDTYPTKDTFTSYDNAFTAYGDAFFVAPVIQFARAHSHQNSGSGKTFLYLFDYSAAIGAMPTSHGAELPYVFGLSPLVSQANVMPLELSNDDQVFAEQVVNYWSNFMRSGDPNSPRSVPVSWPAYDPNTKSHLTFTRSMPPASSVAQDLRGETMPFWLTCFPGSIPTQGDSSFTCPADLPEPVTTSTTTTTKSGTTTTTTTTPKPNEETTKSGTTTTTTTTPKPNEETTKSGTTTTTTTTPKPNEETTKSGTTTTTTTTPKPNEETTKSGTTTTTTTTTTPKPNQPDTTKEVTTKPSSAEKPSEPVTPVVTPKPTEAKTNAPTRKPGLIWVVTENPNGGSHNGAIRVLTVLIALGTTSWISYIFC